MGLVGVLAFALSGVGCVGGKKKEGSPAASASAAMAGPRIAVPTAMFDFGKVTEGDQLTHVFTLKNEGNAKLTLDRVRTSCGCTVANLKAKELAPGASTELEVKFDTAGRHGQNRKVVTIESNDSKSPRTQIEVRADIAPLLGFEPRYVRLTPEYGKTAEQEVRLVGKLASEAKLVIAPNPPEDEKSKDPKDAKDPKAKDPKAAKSEPAKDDVKVELLQDDKGAKIKLSLAGKTVGLGSGRVTLDTGLEKPKQLTLRYSWQVRGTLQVSPSRPYFDPGRGLKERVLRIRSTKADFKLTQANVTKGPFTATIEKTDAGGFQYSVKVALKEGAEPDPSVEGMLVLVSNDALEPKKEIPLRIAPKRPPNEGGPEGPRGALRKPTVMGPDGPQGPGPGAPARPPAEPEEK